MLQVSYNHVDDSQTIADQLADWSETLRKVADVAEKQENKEIAIFNWLSVPKGLQLLESFVVKANESRRLAQLGTPIQSGELKARSRVKTEVADEPETTQAVADRMAAEIEGRLGKATPKPPAATKKQGKRKAE